MKARIWDYLKIIGGLFMIFPFVHTFFALDYGLLKGGIIAGMFYAIILPIGILMFKYLEGDFETKNSDFF